MLVIIQSLLLVWKCKYIDFLELSNFLCSRQDVFTPVLFSPLGYRRCKGTISYDLDTGQCQCQWKTLF